MAGSEVLRVVVTAAFVTPQAGSAGSRAQPLVGSCRGHWEEEAICVEMKVSMTPWLDGSR